MSKVIDLGKRAGSTWVGQQKNMLTWLTEANAADAALKLGDIDEASKRADEASAALERLFREGYLKAATLGRLSTLLHCQAGVDRLRLQDPDGAPRDGAEHAGGPALEAEQSYAGCPMKTSKKPKERRQRAPSVIHHMPDKLQAMMIDVATALATALDAVNAAILAGQDVETLFEEGSVIEPRHLVPLYERLRSARSHLRYVIESDLPEMGAVLGVRVETFRERLEREREAAAS